MANYSTRLTDATLAQVHVIIKTHKERIPKIDHGEVEARLVEATRSFVDHLEDALIAAHGEEKGIRALRRFERAFPAGYQEQFDQGATVEDIELIEKAVESGDLSMNLYVRADSAGDTLNFKIYVTGKPVPLSDILPMLENMGLKVIGEVPYKVMPQDATEPVWIHDFYMEVEGGREIDMAGVREDFHDAFHRVWHGQMENDGFNKLVLHSGLTSRQVIALRAYCKYLRQARIPFSQAYMEETLVQQSPRSPPIWWSSSRPASIPPSRSGDREKTGRQVITRRASFRLLEDGGEPG